MIHSRLARDAGLGLSLLERLTSAAPYAAVTDASAANTSTAEDAAGDQAAAAAGLIVKLVRNYRSHPELLKLPSRLFYGEVLCSQCHTHRQYCFVRILQPL